MIVGQGPIALVKVEENAVRAASIERISFMSHLRLAEARHGSYYFWQPRAFQLNFCRVFVYNSDVTMHLQARQIEYIIVSDEDGEIQTQGLTDNTRNEVYLVSGIIR